MNCDLVFEILTRGPFPSGEPTDASVESHLARCHECRELAEALRPAVSLFHEALASEDECRGLPGYFGSLSEAAPAFSTAVAVPAPRVEWRATPAPVTAALRGRGWRRSVERVRPLASGIVLGAALCLVAAVMLARTATPPEPLAKRSQAAAPGAAITGLALAPDAARASLISLHLPAACWTRPAAVDAVAPVGIELREGALPSLAAAPHAQGHLLCCTHCHNAAAAHRPPVTPVALLQREACVVCHRFE